jgi:uncharacterized protein YndB with AHSA1/START domain
MKEVPKLSVRREIAASPKDLFDAWLDPAKLAIFMRPSDIKRSVVKVDPRVGGAFEVLMHASSGPIPHTGTYREIDRPRRLVFTWNSDHAGNIDSIVTVEFRPVGNATEIVLTHEGLPSKDEVDGHTKGWTSILGLLDQAYGERRAAS